MMLNCRQASRLISEAMDRPLSRAEQARLAMHLMLCSNCRNFRQQMRQLREGIRKGREL
ncbi:zf-HC2 domain-containing protein [Vogesella sp. LIG4]|uniref:zf-HC2 domain-containing protein n=1 Tax=Vogesella sp. LIG4 TaxID=1192162 RepID=UPI00081FCB59|nr:zf-HC2 domain-containing protein [Vogesella sp. LIG4]SCK22688.1 Putative zinc-finger [Vogesella sp. LIG4]